MVIIMEWILCLVNILPWSCWVVSSRFTPWSLRFHWKMAGGYWSSWSFHGLYHQLSLVTRCNKCRESISTVGQFLPFMDKWQELFMILQRHIRPWEAAVEESSGSQKHWKAGYLEWSIWSLHCRGVKKWSLKDSFTCEEECRWRTNGGALENLVVSLVRTVDRGRLGWNHRCGCSQNTAHFIEIFVSHQNKDDSQV